MVQMMSKYSAGHLTRLRITEATMQLVREKPFDRLSVEDICKAADVCRATFYYHFKDKFDVAQWHFDLVASEYLNEIGRSMGWQEAFEKNTYQVYKYKELYLAAFSVRGYQSLFSYAKRSRREALREAVEARTNQPLDKELEFQIYGFVEAEVGSLSHWFKTGMELSVDKLCRYLVELVPKRLFALLNEPVS